MIKQYARFLSSLAISRQETKESKGILSGFLMLFILLGFQMSWGQSNDGYPSVLKVTSGATLTSTGTAIVIEEYLPSSGSQGAPNVSNPLSSASGTGIVTSGSGSTNGQMTRSENGMYLCIPGYSTGVAGAITTACAIRTVNGSGSLGAGINAPNLYTAAGDFRGAASDDGSRFWASGGATGIRYSADGTTIVTVSTSNTNQRMVNIFNGQLFYSASAGTTGLYQVATGKPIVAGTTNGTSLLGTITPNGFSISPDGLTIYAALSGTVSRYTYSGSFNPTTLVYSGGIWSSSSILTLASVSGVAVDWSGYSFTTGANGAVIYAITPLLLVRGSDNGTSTITTTTLRTISGNNAFRGIALSPIKQTVSKGTNTPVAGNITQGTTSVVLFQFNLKADEGNSTMKKVIVNQGGTATIGTSNNISNFKLVYDANGDGAASAGEISAFSYTGSVSGSNITFSGITPYSGNSAIYIPQGSSNNYLVLGDVNSGTGTFIPRIVADKTINSGSANYTTNLVNAGGSPVTIGASVPTGNTLTIVAGSTPNLAITIAPLSASTFTSVCTNTGTSSVTYRITNSGTVDADGVQVALSGANPGDYTISGFTAGSTIAASGTADFTVTFDPSVDGTRTASAGVTSTTSGSNSPSASLSGVGIASATQTATTNTPTPVGGTTATLKGTYALGICPGSSLMGFVYSKTAEDGDPLQGGTFVTTTSTTAAAGAFSLPVTGLTAGTSYTYKAYIFDGTYTYGSAVQFTTSPANDACASATALTVGVAKIGETFTSSNPTSGLGTNKDVWYSFTPSCSGTHTISVTFDEGPDLNFEVYPATTCPTSTTGRLQLYSIDLGNVFIANGTNSGDETADLETAVAGTTYYIRVIDGANNAVNFDISVTTTASSSIALTNTGSPSAASIAAGANNIVLFGFALTPTVCTTSYTFSGASIATSGTAAPSDLSNFRLIADSNTNGIADAGEYATPVGTATFTTGNPLLFSFAAQTLTAGTANRYLLIADVDSFASNGNTFTASLINTDVTANQTVTDSAVGNEQSITATSITIADNGTQIGAGNIIRGSNNNIISKAKFTVVGGTASVTQINFVTAGSAGAYVQADIATNGFKLWRSASSTVLDTNTDTLLGSVSSGKGATATNNDTLSFTTSESLAVGDYYYWLTVDLSNTAVSSRTVTVNGLSNTSVTSAGVSLSGSTSAAGVQTIVAPNLSAGTLTAFGNVCINTTSGANSFTLSGANLNGTNVTIGPLAGFIFDAGSGYGTTATISGYGTSIATSISVKFAPTAVQPYGGTGLNGIPVSGGDAPTVYVNASGTAINITPAVSSAAATSINNTIATLNGSVTTLGVCPAATTQKGFVYSITATNSDPIDGGTGVTTTSVAGLATGAYLLNLTGLNAATGYTFKAYLFDGTTYTYGAATTFTTLTPADHLVFVSVPTSGSTGTNLTSFTVEARRPNEQVDNTYTSNIVITKATGSGTLSGTTTKAAVAGVATFNDLQLSTAGNYTLNANSGALPQITSGTIAVGVPASATWVLTANSGATPVGNVTATAQTGGSGIGTMTYTANGVTSNGWGTVGQDANDYYQFTISPTAGNDLVVSSIATTNNLSSQSATGVIQYSLSPSFSTPGTAGTTFSIGTGAATNTFSGLSIAVPNTQTLYVRIFIYQGPGNTIGSGQTVRCRNFTITGSTTTAILAPTVTTTAASAITTTGASSGGNVTSDGGGNVTSRGVAFGTSTAPTTGTSDGIGTGTFTSTLSGLLVNTRYFYRAYATNSINTSYGSESNFYTLANTPGIAVVNNPTFTSLDVTLDVTSTNSNPSNTEYAIQETSTNKYVQANGTLDTNAVWQTASAWGTKTVSPLASSTTYTFRLKARNGDNVETGFGNGASATTDTPIIPTLSAGTLTAFGNVCVNTTTGANSFTLSGTNLDGSDVTVGPLDGFTFDAGSGYGTTATISGYGTTISTSVNVKFTPSLVQAYGGTGINGIPVSGGTAASINVDASGTGIDTAPTVITGSPSGITALAATLAGNITVVGCSAISSYGIEYSTTDGFGNGTGTPVNGTGYTTGPFTASVSGLLPNTTYYYHAFAGNTAGTGYSLQSSFVTAGLDAPIANAATLVTSNSFVANWTVVTGASSYRLDVSTSPTFGSASTTTDLFISEYVEGSSSNKYIEIYNGTGASVNLADYRLRSYANGAIAPGSDVQLTGTLANGSTIVYKNSGAAVYGGASTSNGALNYNGNDAVALFKISTSSNVDIFGRIGEDPGTGGWTAAGGYATTDKTLVRKASVTGGVTTNPAVGFPTLATEWNVSNVDVVTNLGSHTFTSTFIPSYVGIYNDLTVAGTSQSVAGLSPSTVYYYRARAFAASSLSANSNTITVTTLANPSVTISGATEKCSDAPAVTWTANPTGGVTPYTYSWDTTPVQTGVTASISVAGTYTVTVTDNNNVIATASRTLTVNTAAVADAPADVTACDSYTLPALTNGNYFTGSGGTGTALFAGNSVTSTQTLYVYSPATAPCVAAENSFLVTINHTPVADAPSDVVNCGSYALPALTNGNYFTGAGGTGTALFAGNLIASTQTLYVYSPATSPCVAAEHSFTVTIKANPIVTASDVSGCSGTPIALFGSGTPSGGTGNYSVANPYTGTSSTTYTYTYTAPNGCIVASAPANITITAQPLWYLDADGDQYYTGAGVPSCTSPGTGYTTATLLGGGDCNDSNFDINPGHAEVCYNNVNDNCSTLVGGVAANLSEGCAPVVVNMTPSYDNTILPSFSTAVPAVGYTYPGTSNIKYRFSITNVTTSTTAPDIIQASRYVNIPASIHLYGATYTIKVSAVINDEVVGFFGNTITLTAPAIQLITLAPASCGATLGSLTSILTANPGANATGYTFRIRLNDANPSPAYAYSSSSSRFVGANTFTDFPLSYGTSYKVAVEYTFTDPLTSQPVHSLYGTECIVNTPSIPTTTIASPTCGAQVGSLTTGITAAAAAYATSYQFRIRVTTDNGPTPAYKYTLPNASRFSSMAAIQGITWAYNTNYSVSVRYSISPTEWSEYGPECILKTPFFPSTQLVQSQCGLATPTSLTQQLNIIPYPGFPNYKVKLEENTGTEGGGAFEEKVFSYAYFRLNQFALAQPGKSYYVSVAIKQGAVFGDYSTVCDLFTPSSKGADLAFKATAYPNPFANNFMIDVRTSNNASVNLKVYDMLGRLIEQRDVRVSDMGTTTIGDRYPSGVYNVVVSQQDSVETLRVVKR